MPGGDWQADAAVTCAALFVPNCSRLRCGISSSCCRSGAVQTSGRGHNDKSCSCVMPARCHTLSAVTRCGLGLRARLVRLLDKPVSCSTCKQAHRNNTNFT